MSDTFSLWTVYERPSDYPNGFIARRHEMVAAGEMRPTHETITGLTLFAVRAQLQMLGLVPLNRYATDDPVIVETWL